MTKYQYKPEEQEVDPRVKMQTSSESMPSVFEALVELITNVDDSEERIAISKNERSYKGKILIEHKRGKEETIYKIKDSAEGMSYEDICNNFKRYGTRQAGSATRGYAGRGAKDIVSIGPVTIKSIKNNLYSEAELYNRTKTPFQPVHKNVKVKPHHRLDIGIKRGSGSCISFKFDPRDDDRSRYNTISDTIIRKLPNHYALRSILNDKNGTLSCNYKKEKGNAIKLTHTIPKADLIYEEEFYINEYKRFKEDAKVSFKLFRSDVSLESQDNDPKFRQYGIFVYSKKACHENTLFNNSSIENSSEAKYYYGTIQTNLINALLDEFEEILQSNDVQINYPDDNPSAIIDLRRLGGLSKKHPATKLIYKKPEKTLFEFIKEDIKKKKSDDVEDDVTKDELKKIADICSELMKDIFDEPDIDPDDGIPVNKWMFKPPKHKMHEDDFRDIYLFTRPESLKKGYEESEIRIKDEYKDFISVENLVSGPTVSKKNDKYIFFKFRIKALKQMSNIVLEAFHAGSIKTSVVINIEPVENRVFNDDLEFKKKINTCEIDDQTKKGKLNKLVVYAKVPELINEPTKGSVYLTDPEIGKISNEVTFKPYKSSNYAVGEIRFEGKKTGVTKVNVELNDKFASADIKVVYIDDEDDEEEDKGNFKITIEQRMFGESQRAAWNVEDPAHLQIAGEHPSVKRYLGNKLENYPGQRTTLYKLLQAEIISEYMTQKQIEEESYKIPDRYNYIRTEETTVAVNRINIDVVNIKNSYLKAIHKVAIKETIIDKEIQKSKDLE